MYKKISNKKFWLSFVLALLVSFTGAFGSALAAGAPVGEWFFRISVKRDQGVQPSTAYNSKTGEYLVVYKNDLTGNDNIRAVKLSRGGKVLSNHLVVYGPGAERRYPDVTYNPEEREYLVVWEHFIPAAGSTPQRHSIRAQRLDENGTPKGGEIVIANPADRGEASKPAVDYASTSKYYMVVWETQMWNQPSKSIHAQLVHGAGGVAGSNFNLAKGSNDLGFSNPDLAYNHRTNKFLVAWERANSDRTSIDIYGKLVTGDGAVLNNTSKILWETQKETNPSVAVLPNYEQKGQFMVVAEIESGLGDTDIVARRVLGDGSLLGAHMVSNLPFFDETNPSVAGNEIGNQYLVTWTGPWNEREPVPAIYAETVSPSGANQGDYTVMLPPGTFFSSVVKGPMGDFLVAAQLGNIDGWHIVGRLWKLNP